jgi:nicotinamidase-related amidase
MSFEYLRMSGQKQLRMSALKQDERTEKEHDVTERVWDKFLTENDKEALGNRAPKRPVPMGKKPGLLLIDLYRNVFGDGPEPEQRAIKDWPGSCGQSAWDSVPHIQRLLEVSREVGIPVTHVTMLVNTGVEGWGDVRRNRQAGRFTTPKRERDDLYEIIPEVGPIEGEAVIRKVAPSAFWGTPLTGHLNYNEVDTLIVCGESTSGCVRASVVDACTNRYRVIVAEEAVFDRADVLSVEEIVGMLRAWKDGQSEGQEAITVEAWLKAGNRKRLIAM